MGGVQRNCLTLSAERSYLALEVKIGSMLFRNGYRATIALNSSVGPPREVPAGVQTL